MKRIVYAVLLVVMTPGSTWAQRPDLSGLTICIDPGHGGHNPANDRLVIPDPGVEFWESESNFRKALLLDTLLAARGATVLLTRYTNDYPNDDEPSLTARWEFANANNADWFHSIHSNAFNGVTNYTLVLLKEDIPTRMPAFPQALTMSQIIAPKIRSNLRTSSSAVALDYTFYGGPNGGFNLGVLRGLVMPGELSEGSFHDVFPETRRLLNNSYRKMEAYALRDAFLQYYTVPADTLAIVAGIQSEIGTGRLLNNTVVRILPEDRVYTGDTFNNGFFMFDNLAAGTKVIRFETPGYSVDSLTVTVGASARIFADHQQESLLPPTITLSTPANGDTLFSANQPVEFQFSKVMDTSSVRSAFSITPGVAGRLLWSNTNTRLTFDPDSILPFFVYFTVVVDTTARSLGGQTLDGDGNGTPGDPYVLSFRTRDVDAFPPQIVSRYPSANDTLRSPTDILNVTFDEKLNPATVTQTNVSVQQIGGSVQPRDLQYWESGIRSGINIYLTSPLLPGFSYRVRVSGVTDAIGNPIPNSVPIIWQFAVAPGGILPATIDAFDTALVNWWQPGQSGSTVGIDSARFSEALSVRLPGADNVGSARLQFDWNTGAGSWLIREYLAGGPGRNIVWRKEGAILRAGIHGDGGNNEVRLCVADSNGYEVSRWFRIDWIGWREVEWDLEHDSIGTWLGDGHLDGDLRFDSFQLRYLPGISAETGTLYIDELRLENRIVTGVDAQESVPLRAALMQNYPNPFNPVTRIRFELSSSGPVSLRVYDVLGRLVETIIDGHLPPGVHSVDWNGARHASGMYLYRLVTDEGTMTKQMLLLK